MADFGDILAEWEQRDKQKPQRRTASPARKADAPEPAHGKTASGGRDGAEPFARSANPIDAWLSRHPVIDKDASPGEAQERAARSACSADKARNAARDTADAPSPERTARLLDAWLSRYPVVDKDALDRQAREQAVRADTRAARKLPYDTTLDLHGYTHDEARDRLDRFIAECVQRNVRKALIIHGKGLHSGEGDAVLPKMVRAFIERDPRLGASGHPDNRDGGKGATWVIIR